MIILGLFIVLAIVKPNAAKAILKLIVGVGALIASIFVA